MCLFFFSLINGTLCIKCLMAHLLFFFYYLFVCFSLTALFLFFFFLCFSCCVMLDADYRLSRSSPFFSCFLFFVFFFAVLSYFVETSTIVWLK